MSSEKPKLSRPALLKEAWDPRQSDDELYKVPLASHRQVGGTHYKDYPIEPGYFNQKNKIGYMEGTAIKYICRHALKGGIQDLDKAIHCLELAKEWEYGE